jgi:hypothetical protein
MKIGVFL